MSILKVLEKYEIDFFNREEILNQIDCAYENLSRDKEYFQIISIDGMGGIGKSRLLKQATDMLEKKISKEFKIINFSLEISKSDNILSHLIKLRKNINKPCPLFDYAMLHVWSRVEVSKLDDQILLTLKNDMLSTISQTFELAIWNYPIGTFLEFLGDKLYKLQNLYNKKKINNYFTSIKSLRTNDLISCLPEFLGIDISRLYSENYLIIVADAYEQYDSECLENWIQDLIMQIQYGLHIITSREKINWTQSAKKYVKNYRLSALPRIYANKLLKKYLGSLDEKIIENILEITECIPIYLDIYINTYQNNPNIIKAEKGIFIKSKKELIEHFFDHLNKEEHDTMIVLSLVQIFDRRMFESLMKDLHLGTNVLRYDDISQLSMIQNMIHDYNLYKVHDVISFNVINILSYDKRYRIFKSYLNAVRFNFTVYKHDQKIILYKHIFQLIIKNNFSLKCEENELILDMFFLIKRMMVPVHYDSIKGFKEYIYLKEIYYFIRVHSEERADTEMRLGWLNYIDIESCNFGKHIYSLNLIRNYLIGLTGNHQLLIDYLDELNDNLTDCEINEWYYGQSRLFYGDSLATRGKFNSSIKILKDYKVKLQKLMHCSVEPNFNDLFQINRHLGHCYRYNMILEKAEKYYNKAISSHIQQGGPTVLQKLYIYTNICETLCYFQYQEVIRQHTKYLQICYDQKDLKSMAKIYYSSAIAYIQNKKFKKARKYIHKSLYYNTLDGYRTGILFDYWALVILDLSMDCQHFSRQYF